MGRIKTPLYDLMSIMHNTRTHLEVNVRTHSIKRRVAQRIEANFIYERFLHIEALDEYIVRKDAVDGMVRRHLYRNPFP